MKITHVKIQKFKALEDIDIRFEKSFSPSIFPLGSQNGGGKSTLLQLIFSLLHFSGDSKRHPFLKNMIQGVEVEPDKKSQVIAEFELFDEVENKELDIQFLSCNDSFLRDIFEDSSLQYSEPEKENNVNSSEDEIVSLDRMILLDNSSLSFSILDLAVDIEQKINNQKDLQKVLRRVESGLNEFKKTGDSEILDRQMFSIRKFSMDAKDLSPAATRLLENFRRLSSKSSMQKMSISLNTDTYISELKEEISFLEESIKDLTNSRDDLIFQRSEINRILEENGYEFITRYSERKNSPESGALLCTSKSIKTDEISKFLKRIADHVFLAAPSTQVYHFLSEQIQMTLFKSNLSKEIAYGYDAELRKAKEELPGFFTYDFLAVDTILGSFKDARDKDFKEAIETEGQYGENYKNLLNELSLLLSDKKLIPDNDFSSVIFRLEKNGKVVNLLPQDLSHGELKRLSIYMWIRDKEISRSIVLMDEIEIAFHPDWQFRIVEDLIQWGKSNQYILATHSYALCEALTPDHVKEIEPKLLK